VVAFRRFEMLIKVMGRIREARADSSKCLAASSEISSGAGFALSLSGVRSSVSVRAARLASVEKGGSRQAVTAQIRSSIW
jgi:hypothetical protein